MSQSNSKQRAFAPNGRSKGITSTDPRAVGFPTNPQARNMLACASGLSKNKGSAAGGILLPRVTPRSSTIKKHPVDAGKTYLGY